MAKKTKKIKFALEMKDGIQVRNLEDLRNNFDLEKTVGYFLDGKLITWLNDRYYEEEAEELEQLSKNDAQLNKKLCKILGVEYQDEELDPEEIERRNERIAKLKQYTDNQEFIDNVDLVAFDQEDLADLLDEDEAVIYLCQNKFIIPLRAENKKYIGIGKAEAVIRSKTVVDFAERNIEFVNVSFNAEYEKLLKEEKGSLPTEKSEQTQDNTSITLLQEAKKAEADKDFDVALALYKRVGNAEAMYHMGKIYNNAAYVKYDKQKAINYFKQAAENGNEDAKNLINLIAPEMSSIEEILQEAKQAEDNKDFEKALNLYKEVVNIDDSAEALYFIGRIYNNSEYLHYNKEKAINCFEFAANADNKDAKKIMKEILEEIFQEAKRAEADKDFVKAINLYKKAAGMGSSDALYFIGKIHSNFNKKEAMYYFKLAADAGNEEARNLISLIEEISQNNTVKSDNNYNEDDDDTDYDYDDEEDDDNYEYIDQDYHKNIFEKVRDIIVEQLGVEPYEVNSNTTLDDLGADSLDAVELIMTIEEEFLIEIPDKVAERMRTVHDIVVYLGNH